MNGVPDLGSPATSGLLGVLRSWLQALSSESGEPPVLPLTGAGWLEEPFPDAPRVLVVDDNPANLMLMSVMLESRGLLPLLAEDGAEAVALACELNFDLILMDLQMPILDGLAATLAIRRFETDCSRPAVPVIAYSSTSLGASALAAHGLNGSLGKPCEAQELDDCLVRWCPTYRPAPAVRMGAHANTHLHPPRRASTPSSASLR